MFHLGYIFACGLLPEMNHRHRELPFLSSHYEVCFYFVRFFCSGWHLYLCDGIIRAHDYSGCNETDT